VQDIGTEAPNERPDHGSSPWQALPRVASLHLIIGKDNQAAVLNTERLASVVDRSLRMVVTSGCSRKAGVAVSWGERA
jgi:hypothetical protein